MYAEYYLIVILKQRCIKETAAKNFKKVTEY